MEQIDYKEKYEQALERARQFSEKPYLEDSAGIVEYIFPELAESEDERIRKVLLNDFKNNCSEYYCEGVNRDMIIAWLEKQGEEIIPLEQIILNVWELGNYWKELTKGFCNTEYGTQLDYIAKHWKEGEHYIKSLKKQGEQKPAGKVEPKFKIGDFIVNDYCMGKVVEITNDAYLLDTEQGIPFSCHSTHLWDITKDANDGDVLSWDNSKCIALFKNIYGGDSFNSYGCVGHCTGIFEPRQAYHDIEGAHPATKEQRDQLQKAMADAGYTFDFEKKELKKIEQNPAGKKTTLYDNMDDLIADAMIDDIKNADMPEHCKHNRLTWINKHRSKPAEWSDKDEAMITLLHNIIDHHYSMDIIKKEEQLKLEDWLKFLKDRVLPKPAEWSEKDENHVKSILSTIECCKAQFQNSPAVVESYNTDVEWLNSLRPQNRWKPSDEQIIALRWVLNNIPYNKHKEEISGLLDQIKEL